MSIRKTVTAALVASAMVVVPTVAQAAQANQSAASKLSVRSAQVRSGATVAQKNQLAGSLILAIVAAAAVIGGVIIASNGNNNPASP